MGIGFWDVVKGEERGFGLKEARVLIRFKGFIVEFERE